MRFVFRTIQELESIGADVELEVIGEVQGTNLEDVSGKLVRIVDVQKGEALDLTALAPRARVHLQDELNSGAYEEARHF